MGGEAAFFECEGCGKRYPWRPAIAGRKGRCACGHIMAVPAEEPAMMLADGPAADALAPVAPMRPSGVPLDVQLAAERARKRADAERREREESEAKQNAKSPLRDQIMPLALIVVGIILLFVEAMTTGKAPAKTAADALPIVLGQAALKVGLMLGGVYLAVQFMDVTLVGSMLGSLFKLCAIAIGTAAVKGLLHHAIGDLGGITAGVFGTVVLYAVLFRWLLRTDARDTAICVAVVFIMGVMIEYLVYKFGKYSQNSWI